MSVSIIGGDLRMIRLAQLYSKEQKVYTYGFEKYFEENLSNPNNEKNNISIDVLDFKGNKVSNNNAKLEYNNIVVDKNIFLCDTLEECAKNSKRIISGVPLTKDNLTVTAPYAKNIIELKELKEQLIKKQFIAGNIPEEFYQNDIENFDLLKNDELTILNAIPTVEGAIKIAIEEREETIFDSNVLICGFGRIGKILCDRFLSLGANVYCTARKETDLTWIREKRCIPIIYDKIKEYAPKIDLVINTVPYVVLDKKTLDYFRKDVVMIEIASKPGGFDKEYAKQKGIKVINAQGIPGKEMPMTAAKFIKGVIEKYI